jgi:hypothetical protein
MTEKEKKTRNGGGGRRGDGSLHLNLQKEVENTRKEGNFEDLKARSNRGVPEVLLFGGLCGQTLHDAQTERVGVGRVACLTGGDERVWHCSVAGVLCTVSCGLCTVFCVLWTVDRVPCTVYCVLLCTVYCALCALCILPTVCSLYTAY